MRVCCVSVVCLLCGGCLCVKDNLWLVTLNQVLLSLFHQKCMETKNSILSRQKEMQLSLDKVKHLIRLIQAFSFNKALAETEGKATGATVQDSSERALGSEAAPEANSVEKVQAVSSSTNSNANGNDQQEQNGAAGSSQSAAVGGVPDSQPLPEDSTVLAADSSLGAGSGGKTGPGGGPGGEGGGNTGTGPHSEVVAEAETAPVADDPVTSTVLAVVTTNGTAESAGPDHNPAGDCSTNATANSENKMSAVNPPETAVEKKQEEIADSDGSNTNNSKTSEPSQHSLPALVSSLDNKK